MADSWLCDLLGSSLPGAFASEVSAALAEK